MSAGATSSDSNAKDAAVVEIATKRFYPKTHTNYWKSRLEHRSYTRDGKTFEVAEWSVRIHFNGIRKSFDLETANKEEAAAKARDIYLSILAKGWTATVNELAPQLVPLDEIRGDSTTVGGFLAEVERTGNLKPKTFRYYASCLRQFAAYVQGVKSDASRFDYRKGGATAWRQQVDATPLSMLTPASVADYKMVRLKRAGSDPRRKLEVNRSFNSWLRNTKSLFSETIICKPNFRVKVPKFKVPDGQRGEREVYWFEIVGFERPGSMKFQSPPGITYEALVAKAHHELRAASSESYKLFLLCLCAGLRRGEADVCLWTQLNGDDNSIRIEANKFIEPKHGSGGTVYVDPALMQELLSFKEPGQDGFVVKSPLEWKATTYRRYRCEPHWRALIEWLESNGIDARKKVHELRKLFGDAIVKRNGIFAGSAQLRHSTIQMTASHYTDPACAELLEHVDVVPPSSQPKASDRKSNSTQMKKGLLTVLLVILGIYALGACFELWPEFRSFRNQLAGVANIHISDSRNEVTYRLGMPTMVLGDAEKNVWGWSRSVYLVGADKNDRGAMPEGAKVEDYRLWSYKEPNNPVELYVEFNDAGSVVSLIESRING